MVNHKYKNVCVSDVVLNVPQKSSGEYSSSVHYLGEPLAFQTPKLVLVSTDTAKFSMIKEPLFYSFLEDLQEFLLSSLYKNSESFFKGKKFSEERIRGSIEPICENIDGEVYIRNLSSLGCTFFDLLHEETSVPLSFPYSGRCILQIDGLKFVKSSIFPDIKISSVKISKEERVKPESCILLETEEVEEEVEIVDEEDNLDFFADEEDA